MALLRDMHVHLLACKGFQAHPVGAEAQCELALAHLQEIEAPPSGGYLVIQDDAPISHCMIPNFNKSQVSRLLPNGTPQVVPGHVICTL